MNKEKKLTNPKHIKLNEYEQRIEENYEHLIPLPEKKKSKLINQLIKNTQEYQKKNQRITIRISENDLLEIKKIAHAEGLPYQTYITSMLHKIAKNANKLIANSELFYRKIAEN